MYEGNLLQWQRNFYIENISQINIERIEKENVKVAEGSFSINFIELFPPPQSTIIHLYSLNLT